MLNQSADSAKTALVFFLLLLCCGQDACSTRGNKPIAIVDGHPIYEEDLIPYIQGQLRPLREQEYQIKKEGLENLVNQRLLEAEAKKKGLTADEFLQKEVDSRVAPLTDVELKSAYDHFREKPDRETPSASFVRDTAVVDWIVGKELFNRMLREAVGNSSPK